MKPIILIAFANDWNDPLLTLYAERAGIEKHLQDAIDHGLCELMILEAADTDTILKAFRAYRDRIAIFHFAGHAQDLEIYLETAEGNREVAHSGGFAEFLSTQHGLQLVFLNACSTQLQVQSFLDAGVGAVIATSQAIDEGAATRLSVQFYAGLGKGSSIHKAYLEAASAVKMKLGQVGQHRQNYYKNFSDEAMLRFPWDFYVHPGAEVVKNWNLPDAAGNPLFGIPQPSIQNLPEKPFKYLKWYGVEDANIFFGRSFEIRKLYDRITDRTSPSVIHFYGQSGAGKSSLLAAGLLPRINVEHEVRYIRRDSNLGLDGSIRTLFDAPIGESLRQNWIGIEDQTRRPLTIILDQVEEMYIQAVQAEEEESDNPDEMKTQPNPTGQHAELDALILQIDQIFGHEPKPQGKLILAYRKEYLAEVESRFVHHKIAYSKVFLDVLSHEGIRDAIFGLTSTPRLREAYQLEIEPELASLVAHDLLKDQASAVAPVLQILLSKLWENCQPDETGKRVFTRKMYQTLEKQGLLLDDFLDQKMTELRMKTPELVKSGLVQDILTFHTTSQGTAQKRTLQEILDRYPHRSSDLPELLTELKMKYLLVEAVSDGHHDRTMVSLAHDTLSPLIREKNQMSEWPGQIALRIINDRVTNWEKGGSRHLLNAIDLEQVELGMPGMRSLTLREKALVIASQKKRRLNRLIRYGILVLAISVTGIIIGLVVNSRNLKLKQLQAENQVLLQQIEFEKLNNELSAISMEKDSLEAYGLKAQSEIESFRSSNLEMSEKVEIQDLSLRAREIVMDFVPLGFSGSVFFERDQQNILSAGFGLRQREKKLLFEPRTAFALGSLTEVFTTIAVMQLMDQDQLRLSNTLSLYFKDVPPDKAAITIQQLLQHRSGLAADQREDFGKTSIETAKRKIFRQKLGAKPGEKIISSPSNYRLLAMIVEIVSGEEFKAYCGKSIFRACGMTQTGYNDLRDWPPAIQAEGFGIKKRKSINPGNWPEVSWGAMGSDGLISSTADLARFLHQLLHGNLLTRQTVSTMFSLGLGWKSQKNEVIFQNGTGSLGQGVTIRYYPEKNAQLIILTNSYSGENPPIFVSIAKRFEKELLEIN